MIEKNQIPALDIVQSTARMMKTLLARRLYEFGLYAGQDRIILSLALNDGQSPGSLAKQLGVKPPTVTKTIARLQEQGFVTKRGSHKDQRQLHVFLTKDGHKVVKLIEAAIAATERDITYGLNENEHVTLLKLLGRIQKNVEEQQLELSNIYAENENGIF
ncbi:MULTISPECIES: MarR family winged helix-turn-helix transcriptional regulator [Bartonella]|uniref:DNA-binding transcriptional regulator, MarR family n=1 Tax=Bartonella choladocola TaxID=2750995 RepID=A0A1U9MJV0_9HYPH|nr:MULTISPECIES: MarR family transcriptional regulator [Bartonella]AQT48195.1 DNA-binding transcriptional regulator, MarR family [Bartonella choladocola]MBH9976248.1 MarR family transcriptional regulator [Bartonella choladocola]MBI0015888.1 MarR family transcriptional regulator [Bartonella sp. B10834G3]